MGNGEDACSAPEGRKETERHHSLWAETHLTHSFLFFFPSKEREAEDKERSADLAWLKVVVPEPTRTRYQIKEEEKI
uniref:Uncharacterized protein n=1 Tax=Oryza glumipatula TaxID=40148 RepID=A0A0D9Z0W8_9ORYZ